MSTNSPKKNDLLTQRKFNNTQNFLLKTSFDDDYKDARHLTTFLNKSHYSTWRTQKRDIAHKASPKGFSPKGDYFFHSLKQDKNISKIGFTPIFPLVTQSPLVFSKESIKANANDLKRQSNNSFKSTDPITMRYGEVSKPKNFERLKRLVECRHPHGMTGVDHNEAQESMFYTTFRDNNSIRQEPNSHQSFLIDKEWKAKRRSQPPIDEWKLRQTSQIRRFRNQNMHGYNILTNRILR